MTKILLFALLSPWLAGTPVPQVETAVTTEDDREQFKLAAIEECDDCAYPARELQRTDLKTGEVTRFEVPLSRFADVKELKLNPEHLLLIGELEWGGDFVAIVNRLDLRLVDELRGYRLALSPPCRYAAYIQFSPRIMPEPTTDNVLVYDLTGSQDLNTLLPVRHRSPDTAGLPTFPLRKLEVPDYRVTIPEGEASVAVSSDFTWKDNSSFYFTSWSRPSGNSLVFVDLAGGVLDRRVKVVPIDRGATEGSGEARAKMFYTRSIDFAEDGSVLIQGKQLTDDRRLKPESIRVESFTLRQAKAKSAK